MEDASDFLLRLYRTAREHDVDEFRRRTLGSLRSTIAFSSALWGDARRIDASYAVVPTSLHTEALDGDFLVEWARVQHEDPAVPLLLGNAGRTLRVHVPSFYRARPDMVDMGRRYAMQSMSAILVDGLAPNQVHWLSLYRGDPEATMPDGERDWLDAAMPHLTEAWRINLALHAKVPGGAPAGHEIAVAEAATGVLLRADAGFLAVLADAWSGFDGLHVPSPLLRMWRQRGTFVHLAPTARIDGRRFGELVYLSARVKTGAESLTPRQIEIASLYAQGLSSKEIAQRCSLSPATVRNHIARTYEALDVHGRRDLGRRLDALMSGR